MPRITIPVAEKPFTEAVIFHGLQVLPTTQLKDLARAHSVPIPKYKFDLVGRLAEALADRHVTISIK